LLLGNGEIRTSGIEGSRRGEMAYKGRIAGCKMASGGSYTHRGYNEGVAVGEK
jgi:hypothetical protein